MTQSLRDRARECIWASDLCFSQDAAVLLQGQDLSLFLEDLSRTLKHHLKTLFTSLRVLLKAINSELLDAVLDLLPSSAERCDLGALGEICLVRRRCRLWCIYAGFADLKQVGPSDVHGTHGELLSDGVDVGRFVDHGGVNTAKNSRHPFRRGLLACDESLCTQNASTGINGSTQSIDSNDMRRLLVPRPILLPIACRDLLPRVVKID